MEISPDQRFAALNDGEIDGGTGRMMAVKSLGVCGTAMG